jgi:hypothetical protein
MRSWSTNISCKIDTYGAADYMKEFDVLHTCTYTQMNNMWQEDYKHINHIRTHQRVQAPLQEFQLTNQFLKAEWLLKEGVQNLEVVHAVQQRLISLNLE